jgi:2-polyprenyl-6-methoxyphenol hydroxylase-like FAD-dependent oxidoreductase
VRIAVVGLGMAGTTLACLLADRGADVVVWEQAEDPQPVGAGIWLQDMGQRVLEHLGLREDLAAASCVVGRVDIRAHTGRHLLNVSYDDVPGETPALGVHRGTLFSLLYAALQSRGVPVHLGARVTGVRPAGGGLTLESFAGDEQRDLGVFDLVVGCDGSRSAVRRSMNVAVRDHGYEYGALWSIVDDPDGLAGDCLFQALRGTRDYLGVLPTGRGRTSLFWSVRQRDMAGVVAGGLAAWREQARPLALEFAPLLDRVDELLPATYRDVVVRSPYRVADGAAAVLVGDAAHAMSPQLGTGTSLALADAWTLAHALTPTLAGRRDLASSLADYAALRAGHVRWYQWWTRLMMPVFQSDLSPLAWPRDALAPTVSRIPWVRSQLVTTLTGDRSSPWRRWEPPGLA